MRFARLIVSCAPTCGRRSKQAGLRYRSTRPFRWTMSPKRWRSCAQTSILGKSFSSWHPENCAAQLLGIGVVERIKSEAEAYERNVLECQTDRYPASTFKVTTVM